MEDREYLEDQAVRCRRLASSITDTLTVERLLQMADEYEAKARDAAEQDADR